MAIFSLIHTRPISTQSISTMSLTSEPGSFGLERLPRQDSEISTALEAEQRPSSSSLHSEADPDSPLLIAKRGQVSLVLLRPACAGY